MDRADQWLGFADLENDKERHEASALVRSRGSHPARIPAMRVKFAKRRCAVFGARPADATTLPQGGAYSR